MASRFPWFPTLLVFAALAGSCNRSDSTGYTVSSDVVAADLDGDGLADAVVANEREGGGLDPATAFTFLQNGADPGSFLSAGGSSYGLGPSQLALGDLDGDGAPDLAAALSRMNQVAVLLQDPALAGSFLPAEGFRVGNFPRAVELGDMDSDGFPDMVVTCDATLEVLFQATAIPEGFRPVEEVTAGFDFQESALGDFDGDGDLEIALSAGAELVVFYNSDAVPGTFPDQEVVPLDGGVGALGLGELSGDGLLDAAVILPRSAAVALVVQSGQVPDRFEDPEYLLGGGELLDIVVDDLDGDMLDDLALLERRIIGVEEQFGLTVYLQDGTAPGTFQISQSVTQNNVNSQAMTSADLNADGLPDLAFSQAGLVWVAFQDPARRGTFEYAAPLSLR